MAPGGWLALNVFMLHFVREICETLNIVLASPTFPDNSGSSEDILSGMSVSVCQ